MYVVAIWACEVTEILTQRITEYLLCEEYSDIASLTRNQITDMEMTVAVVYNIF